METHQVLDESGERPQNRHEPERQRQTAQAPCQKRVCFALVATDISFRIMEVADLRAYLEGVVPREDGNQWHVRDRDDAADDPSSEVQASEPVLLYRARVDEEEPKAELFQMRDPAAPRSPDRQRRTRCM